MDPDVESLLNSKSSSNNIEKSCDNVSEYGWFQQKWKTHPKILISSIIFGLSVPIVLPFVHLLIFYYLWGAQKTPVDPNTCSCSCFDTIFKGPYAHGVSGYKHLYFNGTMITLKMWIITILFIVGLYEVFKHFAILGYKKNLRLSMTILLISSLHSHYYGWWDTLNHWNDGFYSQWHHQLFFTATELFSTSLVLLSLDTRKPLRNSALVLIGSVATFHIAIASWDQFYFNVIKGRGKLHQVLRDIFLMQSDVIQAVTVLIELRRSAARNGTSVKHILFKREHLTEIYISYLIMFIYVICCPS